MNKKIQIKNEILRYLGHKDQDIDDVINKLIDNSINEIIILSKERYVYRFFDIYANKDELNLRNSNLKLPGKDIKKHLANSKICVLMAVTLGHEVDTKIRYYEKTSMTKAMILDACATAYIEEVCDKLCIKIERELETNKVLTSRYSPGYGDLPIDIQKDFLSSIDAKKIIGLNASSHSILIPRKSVTAIAGIIDIADKREKASCINCDKYHTCNFSKGGNRCEH